VSSGYANDIHEMQVLRCAIMYMKMAV